MNKFAKFWQKQRFKVLTIGTLIYLILLVVFLIAREVAPQRTGVFALAEIFAPYFFVPLLLIIPFLCWRFTAALRAVFVLGIILFGVVFPPRIGGLAGNNTGDAGRRTVSALTWNFLGTNERGGYLRQLVEVKHPDIVALQEADWTGIDEASDLLQQYPYHLYRPDEGIPPGEVLLSTYPIVDHGIIQLPDGSRTIWDIPRVLWARLDLGQGRTMLVVDAHPISSINTVYNCLYCPQRRDSQIKALQQFLQPLIKRGEHILLLGDMNVTDREPAYRDLSSGLLDAQVQVGIGTGHSWGIRGLNRFWAFFRIDYMFVTPNIKPLNLDTDCSSRGSDHCVLVGRFSV